MHELIIGGNIEIPYRQPYLYTEEDQIALKLTLEEKKSRKRGKKKKVVDVDRNVV